MVHILFVVMHLYIEHILLLVTLIYKHLLVHFIDLIHIFKPETKNIVKMFSIQFYLLNHKSKEIKNVRTNEYSFGVVFDILILFFSLMFFCVEFVVSLCVKCVGTLRVEFVGTLCVEVMIALLEDEGGDMDWQYPLTINEASVK